MSLIFVNTRSQAEMLFHALWRYNDDNLPIALHHGSLDVGQRRKVEAAMAAGKLRAVVCTSTLDLGIDWGDVDLVINVGAPKGASRPAAAHRPRQPPPRRAERGACSCRRTASRCWNARRRSRRPRRGAQDTPPSRPGALDVLAQHVLGMACSQPFDPDQLYREVTSASPYQGLTREGFDKIVRFVATGGYALANYERYAKLKQTPDGRCRIAHPRLAQQYRLNVGTIVEAAMVRVRLARRQGGALKPSAVRAAGRVLGEVEEYFIETAGAGRHLRVRRRSAALRGLARDRRHRHPQRTRRSPRCRPMTAASSRSRPISPTACGSCLPTARQWARLPDQVSDWLRIQSEVSVVPGPDEILVETFPRGAKALSRLLSVRGTARPSEPRHAAHAAARARPCPAARFRRQRICALPSGGSPIWARWSRTGRLDLAQSCSTRTCSATISMPGSPSRA